MLRMGICLACIFTNGLVWHSLALAEPLSLRVYVSLGQNSAPVDFFIDNSPVERLTPGAPQKSFVLPMADHTLVARQGEYEHREHFTTERHPGTWTVILPPASDWRRVSSPQPSTESRPLAHWLAWAMFPLVVLLVFLMWRVRAQGPLNSGHPQPVTTGMLRWAIDGKHNLDVARLVNPSADFVQRLIRGAGNDLRLLSDDRFDSFAKAVDTAEGRELAAKAIFEHVRLNNNLRYERECDYDQQRQEQIVRPVAGLEGFGTANCLELESLYASCLANVKMEPLYIQISANGDRHALAGVWLEAPRQRRAEIDEAVVRKYVGDKSLLVLDCNGLVRGVPGQAGTLPFSKANDLANYLVKHYPIQVAVDISQAWSVRRVND